MWPSPLMSTLLLFYTLAICVIPAVLACQAPEYKCRTSISLEIVNSGTETLAVGTYFHFIFQQMECVWIQS